MKSRIERVVHLEKMYPDVVIPIYKHQDDSGVDIRAYFNEDFKAKIGAKSLSISPNCRYLIPTGIKVAIQHPGYEIQVRPRSGMALKSGLTVLNTPGTIDAGYRGEIGIIVYNSSDSDQCVIKHGDRIAQLVLTPIFKIDWDIVDSVDQTDRNKDGFGSTGIE